jgi:hypothetical protein
MIGRMFKMPGHQRFEYRPRHFDPDKEEFQRRVKANEVLSYDDKDELRYRMAASIKRKRMYSKGTGAGSMRSNITVAIIAVVLSMIAYMLLGDMSIWVK